MKHFKSLAVFVVVLMIPVMVFSANKFAPSKAVAGENNTVVVPLNVTNEDGLLAIDIPLNFSEGVTLKEVTFEGTRVEGFELKIAHINNEENLVIIGLVNQVSATMQPALAAGEGTVAYLVFEVDDPTVTELTISSTVVEQPHHSLVYIYDRRTGSEQIGHDRAVPVFEQVSVSLSGIADAGLPTEFALDQNYPNPFNPSTEINFALPVPSQVRVDVFNVLGQRVTTLVDGQMPAGNHSVTWYGNDNDGSQVSSGVYFYRITAENFASTKKMMLLK